MVYSKNARSFSLTLLNENTLKQHRLQGIESNYDLSQL